MRVEALSKPASLAGARSLGAAGAAGAGRSPSCRHGGARTATARREGRLQGVLEALKVRTGPVKD